MLDFKEVDERGEKWDERRLVERCRREAIV